MHLKERTFQKDVALRMIVPWGIIAVGLIAVLSNISYTPYPQDPVLNYNLRQRQKVRDQGYSYDT